MMKKYAFFAFVLLLLMACQSLPATENISVSQATEAPPTEAPPTETAVPSTNTPIPPTDTPIPPTPTTDPNTTPKPQTLNYLTFHGSVASGEWDQANFDAYLEMNPHIIGTIDKRTLYSSPVPLTFYNLVAKDEPSDVVASFIVGHLRSYVEQGLIADISDLWAEQGWDDVFPASVKELVTVDGKQYFVPLAAQWNPIWYRADIFEEVGLTPPQSWAEMLTTCQTLHEAGYIPITVSAVGWNPPLARWFTILNMRLNGAAFHEALMRGEESYEDPRVRAVFEHWAEMLDHNCFPEKQLIGYGVAANQIYDGEAAMYNLGEWLSESYADGLPDTFDFFNFPMLNPDVTQGEIVHMYGAFMPAQAQNPEAARDFLAFLGSADSLSTRQETLNQLVLNLNVEHSSYSPAYQKGLVFVAEAEHMTQLFEFNTHPDIALKGLTEFARFYPNPAAIDIVIANLEAARMAVYDE